MTQTRSFVLVFVVPLAVFVLLGAVIFGGQALSEIRDDAEVQQAIAAAVNAGSTSVELVNLQRVDHGYGVCGTYRVTGSDKGFSSFYYETVNKKVVLDTSSQAFQSRCGFSTLCDTF